MESILDKIPELINQYQSYAVIAGGILLELLLRIKPSKKPLSLLAISARVLSKVAKICESVSSVLDKLVKDKVK